MKQTCTTHIEAWINLADYNDNILVWLFMKIWRYVHNISSKIASSDGLIPIHHLSYLITYQEYTSIAAVSSAQWVSGRSQAGAWLFATVCHHCSGGVQPVASGQCQSWQSRPPEGTGHTDPSDILQRLTSSGEQRTVSCIKIKEET